MKRLSLHISFWLIYTLQDALMQYLWVNPVLTKIPENTQIWMAIVSAFVIDIPKLLLTYYILMVSIQQIIRGEKKIRMEIVSASEIDIPKLLITDNILLVSIPQILRGEKKIRLIVTEILIVYA